MLADEIDRLLETIDADACTIPLDAHCLVLALQPAGTESEFQAALGEEVERGELLREHHGFAVVGAEHARPHADGVRRFDRDGHGRDRGDILNGVVGRSQRRTGPDHVVGDTERGVPTVLGALGLITPILRTLGEVTLYPEAEWTAHRVLPETFVTCICDPQS